MLQGTYTVGYMTVRHWTNILGTAIFIKQSATGDAEVTKSRTKHALDRHALKRLLAS